MTGTGGRDLNPLVDQFGHISVDVVVRGGAEGEWGTGANNTPAQVAVFLRDLADDVERAGTAVQEKEVQRVRPGQIWADNDGRSEGRTIRVDEISGGSAFCTVLTNRNESSRGDERSKRTTRIKLSRFRPTSTGYRLVEDSS